MVPSISSQAKMRRLQANGHRREKREELEHRQEPLPTPQHPRGIVAQYSQAVL